MRTKKQKQFIFFLLSFLSNGYSLKEAIGFYNEQFQSDFSRYIENNLRSGNHLYQILTKVNFNPYVVFLIKIGEVTNMICESLTNAISFIEFTESQKAHFFTKLFYPLLSFFLVSLLLLFVDIYLLPNLILMTKGEYPALELILASYKALLLLIFFLLAILSFIPKLRYLFIYYKVYKTLNFSKVISLLVSAGYSLKGAIDQLINVKEVQWQASELKELLLNNDFKSFYYLDKDFTSLVKYGIKTNSVSEAIKSYGDLKDKALKLYLDIFYNGVVISLYAIITVIIIVIYLSLINTTSLYSL